MSAGELLPSSDTARRRLGWARLAPALLRDARASLLPKTETEAHVIAAQLEMMRPSIRLLNFTTPLAGAVIVFLANIPPGVVRLWWAGLCALCLLNEVLLNLYRPRANDPIWHVRNQACITALLALLLLAVWISVAYWTWQPGPEHRINHLFNIYLLACTLAVASTVLSIHAGTALLPVTLLSIALIATPVLEDLQRNDALIGISVLFIVVMVGQANATHTRVKRMLLLEHERGRLIEELREAKAESDTARTVAEEASQAKSAFLANMSHELRTPLNAIIGFSDIIRVKSFAGGDRIQEYGGFIHSSGRSLLGLINQILDMANIDAGRKRLSLEQIDFPALLVAVVEGATERAHAQGVELSCHVEQNLPPLRADMRAVRQILENLLSNALKFTPPSGTVEVSAGAETDHILLTVRDTGPGVPPEQQAHIFDRFGHHGSRTADSRRGIGLGLPLVKALVDLHGGTIALESAPGKGTTVTVDLPTGANLQLARA